MQDVVYAAANLRAMSFIGGGAQSFQEFFEFLGTVKDKWGATRGLTLPDKLPGRIANTQGDGARQ